MGTSARARDRFKQLVKRQPALMRTPSVPAQEYDLGFYLTHVYFHCCHREGCIRSSLCGQSPGVMAGGLKASIELVLGICLRCLWHLDSSAYILLCVAVFATCQGICSGVVFLQPQSVVLLCLLDGSAQVVSGLLLFLSTWIRVEWVRSMDFTSPLTHGLLFG